MSITLTSAGPTLSLKSGHLGNGACSPVVQKVVLEDLQEGLTEALQGLSVVLDPLHVREQTLCGVPDLEHRDGLLAPRRDRLLPHPPPAAAED